MWEKWLTVCKKINGSMERFFAAWTLFVTKHTVPVMLISAIICVGFVAGFVKFEQRNQGIRLYYPQSSTAWDELDVTEKNFNSYVLDTSFILTLPTRDSNNKILSYNNAIRDDIFKFALEIHDEVVKISKVYNGKVMTLRDLCIQVDNKCLYTNALEIFDYNMSKIQNVGAALKQAYLTPSKILQGGRNLQGLSSQLFGRHDASGPNLTATAVRFIYRTNFGKTLDMYNRHRAIDLPIEDIFKKYQPLATKKGFYLVYLTERTSDDAIDESSGGNFVLVIIAITLMLTLCSMLTMRIRDPVGGHFLMSAAGIGSIFLGIGGAFGLVMLSGQPYVAFVGVLPFLVLAIGVDDMFIIMDEVDVLDPSITGPNRLVVAMKNVGASLAMTSMTDVIAFIVTSSSDLPSIRWFCIYAAVSITFSYLMMMSFFLSLFVYDIKRIESGRRDIVPFLKVPNRKSDPWGMRVVTVSEKFMDMYGKFLMRTPTKVVVVLVYVALIGTCIYGATKVVIGLDPKLSGSDSTEFVKYTVTAEVNFPTSLWFVSVVSQDPVNYSLNKTQQYFKSLDTIVKGSTYYKDTTYNCFSAFLSWAERNNLTHTGANFYPTFRSFLLAHPQYLPDLKFSTNHSEFLKSGNGELAASRIGIFPNDNPVWSYQQGAMNDIRKRITAMNQQSGSKFIPVSFNWVYIELLEVIGRDTGRNLGISAAVILLITLPYVFNPLIAITVLLMFGGIVVILFALMAVLDIELNGVSAIIIIMSIGFSVDYMAHIAHAYVVAKQDTPEERMIHALKTIGRSVVKGGVSTFVGIVVTVFSTSKIFIIFFKLMVGIVVLGLLHGLLFLPIFLTIFARSNLNLHAEESNHVGNIETKNQVIENVELEMTTAKNAPEKTDVMLTKYMPHENKEPLSCDVVIVNKAAFGEHFEENGKVDTTR